MSPNDPPDAPGAPDPDDLDDPVALPGPTDRSDPSDRSGRSAPPTEADLIERLAEALVDNLGGDAGLEREALSIGIVTTGADGLSLAVRPLIGPDPVVELLGFVAPASWSAVGIVSTARWANLTDGELAGVPHRRRRADGRARLAYLVTRTGASLVVLQQEGAERITRWFAPGHEHVGRIDDVCRRMLGLPTRPPSYPPLGLWAVMWADSLVRRGSATRLQTWREVALSHPVVARLAVDDESLLATATDDLVELAASYANLLGWAELRSLCARGQWPLVDADPDDVAWMDDGMFSRWAVADLPELDDLLDDVDLLLPEALRRRVRIACVAWGLT
jgi:hypothetical protein